MPNIFIEEVHKLLPGNVLLLLNMRRQGLRYLNEASFG